MNVRNTSGHLCQQLESNVDTDITFIFVVDTEQYAGNFERPLCAYMTGRIGDCGVGKTEQKIFDYEMGVGEDDLDDEKHPFQFVIDRADEHGCNRPVSIWPTPGWFNDGMGGHFKDGQEAEAQAHHAKECLKYAKEKVHPQDRDDHIQRWTKAAKEPISKYPAYLSVAVFMERYPTGDEIRLLIKRANAFVKHWNEKIKITGFRLLKEETILTLAEEIPNE